MRVCRRELGVEPKPSPGNSGECRNAERAECRMVFRAECRKGGIPNGRNAERRRAECRLFKLL